MKDDVQIGDVYGGRYLKVLIQCDLLLEYHAVQLITEPVCHILPQCESTFGRLGIDTGIHIEHQHGCSEKMVEDIPPNVDGCQFGILDTVLFLECRIHTYDYLLGCEGVCGLPPEVE